MKYGIHRSIKSVIFYFLIVAAASAPCVHAAGTTLHKIREGLHAGYSRLVLECEGALPKAIGPAQANYFTVRYADLTVVADLKKTSSRLRGNVQQIDLQKKDSASEIKLLFETPDAQVKSFIMKSETAPDVRYRLVIDVYPRPETAVEKQQKAAAAPVPAPPTPAAQQQKRI